ncbi:MAG: alpha/beta hydrolase [Burkholderiales bacterium]|nr:alpha/beta hydrolase [Burkholderiales bacterium]
MWRNYTQAKLDAQYDQKTLVSDEEHARHREYKVAESMRVRAKLAASAILDLAYGMSAAEKLDIFKAPSKGAPTQVFIHGGAWKNGKKEDASYPAESFVARGANYIAVNFELVPNVTLDEQVRQTRAAVAWVYKHARDFGADPDRIYVSGHSSGGHLAGMIVTTNWQEAFGLPVDTVKGVTAVSGLFELEPVKLSWRNSYLNLDDAAVARLSPIRHIPNHPLPLVIGYGGGELDEFKRQSREFAATWRARGHPCVEIELPQLTHYAGNYEFNNPQSPLLAAIFAQMAL